MHGASKPVYPNQHVLWCASVLVVHIIGVFALSTTGIQGSDSSEFVLSAVLGSRIHPPGYPLLSLWGSLFQWLSDNPMWNTAVAMGLLHSVAATLLFDALHRWTKDSWLSVWVVAILCAQPLWIRYSTIPEAFPALSLVYAGVVWLLSIERLTIRHALVFATVLCLGIGTHHLFVFTAPALLWLCWQLRRMWWIWSLGILAGFCSYGVLFLESQSEWSWGVVSNITEVLRYFLRADYGTFQITHHAKVGTWWGTPLVYIKTLVIESWGVFAVGAIALSKLRRKEVALFLSWILASITVLALFGMPTDPTYLAHSNRFFVSSMVLWMPFVAMGAKKVLNNLSSQLVLWLKPMLFVPVVLMTFNVPVAGCFDTRMQDWLDHSCGVLPDGALAFVAGDGAVFGSILGQEGLEVCRQVQFVYPRLLVYDWYRAQLRSTGIEGETMVEVLQGHSGPVFSVLGLVGEDPNLPSSVPYGGYWMQYIPPSQPLPQPETVEVHLQEQSQAMRLSDIQHPFLLEQSAESWPMEQWGHSWLALGEGYISFGNESAAKKCFAYGNQWLAND